MWVGAMLLRRGLEPEMTYRPRTCRRRGGTGRGVMLLCAAEPPTDLPGDEAHRVVYEDRVLAKRRAVDERSGELLKVTVEAWIQDPDRSRAQAEAAILLGRPRAEPLREGFVAGRCGLGVGAAPDAPVIATIIFGFIIRLQGKKAVPLSQ